MPCAGVAFHPKCGCLGAASSFLGFVSVSVQKTLNCYQGGASEWGPIVHLSTWKLKIKNKRHAWVGCSMPPHVWILACHPSSCQCCILAFIRNDGFSDLLNINRKNTYFIKKLACQALIRLLCFCICNTHYCCLYWMLYMFKKNPNKQQTNSSPSPKPEGVLSGALAVVCEAEICVSSILHVFTSHCYCKMLIVWRKAVDNCLACGLEEWGGCVCRVEVEVKRTLMCSLLWDKIHYTYVFMLRCSGLGFFY